MPSEVVKKYAKDAGVSVKKAEEAWEEARIQADKKFGNKTKDSHYWAYVNTVTRMKLGLEGKKRDEEKKKKKDDKAKKKTEKKK
jgi:hypothetical protein